MVKAVGVRVSPRPPARSGRRGKSAPSGIPCWRRHRRTRRDDFFPVTSSRRHFLPPQPLPAMSFDRVRSWRASAARPPPPDRRAMKPGAGDIGSGVSPLATVPRMLVKERPPGLHRTSAGPERSKAGRPGVIAQRRCFPGARGPRDGRAAVTCRSGVRTRCGRWRRECLVWRSKGERWYCCYYWGW